MKHNIIKYLILKGGLVFQYKIFINKLYYNYIHFKLEY